jgi:protein tyrosine kinase modulator
MAEELTLLPRTAELPSLTARDVAAVFFRQRRIFVGSFVLIFLSVLIYGWVTPSYQAEMRILVRKGRIDPVITPAPTRPPEFTREPITEEELNSEAELLRDSDILRTVVEQAHLQLPPRPWLAAFRDQSKQARVERAIRRLDSNLKVEALKKTTVISVDYRSSSPAKAAHVLQVLAAAYLQRQEQIRRPSGEFQFFDQQTKVARHELDEAELQLINFGRNDGVVSASLERDMTLQKLSDAAASELNTRVALAETAQRIQSLEEHLRTLPARATTQIRNTDNPQLLEKLKSKLLELELKRTDLLTKFQPSYRLVQEVDQQIAEAKSAIAAEDESPIRDETTAPEPDHAWAKSELLKAQVEFATLAARAKSDSTMLASYRDSAQQLGEQAIQQQELLQEFNAAEANYLLYAKKREEARISDALDRGGILNVALAEQPTVPALPVRSEWAYGFIGLTVAATCGTGLAFAADRLSPLLRTPDEVSLYLRTPVLASLPRHDG